MGGEGESTKTYGEVEAWFVGHYLFLNFLIMLEVKCSVSIRSCVVVHSSHCDVIMNWLWTSLLWWVIGEICISIFIVWGRGYINCVYILMQWIRPPYSDIYIHFTTTLSHQLFLFISDAFYWYSWTHMCGGCWLYQSFSCLQQVRHWSRKRLSTAHSEMHWSWLDQFR